MRFQILSHAGLLVQGGGKSLVFDPWLTGITYWRSWWNYPPVSPALAASLKPDFLYLTHIHWDHFQGASLRKFRADIPIYIPYDPNPRLRRDLIGLGFTDVRELGHGKSVELAPGFTLTSWHFHPFTDSAAVVEFEGTVLFNANDAKFMGGPLAQILRRHPRIDFVFRSHSSANPRLCYDFMDAPDRPRDERDRYLRDFAAFVRAVGARYAVPFASNHCYLHKDVFHLNPTVTTPVQVERYCRRQGLLEPEVKVMVSGDAWSKEEGFMLGESDPFADRDAQLRRYVLDQSRALDAFYVTEAAADVSLSMVSGYFKRFSRALPWAVRLLFRKRPLAIQAAGRRQRHFIIDLWRGESREIDRLDDVRHPLQIHTSSYILGQCMQRNIFLYLGISKRVLYRCRRENRKFLLLIEHFFNMYETGQLPLVRLLGPRFLKAWAPRWRELPLYGRIAMNMVFGKGFEMADYLPAARRMEDWLPVPAAAVPPGREVGQLANQD